MAAFGAVPGVNVITTFSLHLNLQKKQKYLMLSENLQVAGNGML